MGLLSSTANPATTNSTGKTIDYSSQINTLYKNSLGRDAEKAGIDYYQQQLAGGRTLDDIALEIGKSGEAKLMQDTSRQPAKAVTVGKANTYNPTAVKVAPVSTVAGQLESVTANGSPLMTQAETAAKQASASRGLLNSSIAVGAGQEAVYRTALPIAQADASTNFSAATTNANNLTAAAQFGANAQNSNDQFNASQTNSVALGNLQANTTRNTAQLQADTQTSIANNENRVKLQLQQIDTDTRKYLAQMDEGTKVKLQTMDAKDKQLLQTNISAANAYAQLAQALASISTSTNMDAGAKQQATDNQINLFRQNLSALGQVSGLDLSKYFEQVAAPAATTPAAGTGAAADLSGRPGMNGSLTEFG